MTGQRRSPWPTHPTAPGVSCLEGPRGSWVPSCTATAEAIDPARWMHTGDLATMDGDGYINITGRLKDMIIRGGENVSARESVVP